MTAPSRPSPSSDTRGPIARILLVEDDPHIAEFVALELRYEGYEVRVETDGMRGLMAARTEVPDLVVLDRMLPGLDGMEVCRRLRQGSDVPILMLTALGSVPDRVEGLELGANDYLAKPFDLSELLARIKVQIRTRRAPERSLLAFGDLTLDPVARDVRRDEQAIDLTPKEYDLLTLFMQHPRAVLTRPRILEAVWGYDFDGEDNVLEVYIRYLRNKLEQGGRSRIIQTVRGVGYVLREQAP